MYKLFTSIFFALAYLSFAFSSHSGEFPLEEAKVPQCKISGTVLFQEKVSVENSIDLFLPMILFQYQNKAQSLWYSHMKGQYELSKKRGFVGIGMGIRAIFSDYWYLGGRCFVQHQLGFTPNSTDFRMLNLGLEWVSISYQIYVNTYLPLSSKSSNSTFSRSEVVGVWEMNPALKFSTGIYLFRNAQAVRTGLTAGFAYEVTPHFILILKGVYNEVQPYLMATLNINLGGFEYGRERVIEEMLGKTPAVGFEYEKDG